MSRETQSAVAGTVAFEQKLAAAWPPKRWADVPTVVAVSGGADSVALLAALRRLAAPATVGNLIVAHLNHRLRGDESDGDEAFVIDVAKRLGVRCETRRLDVAAAAAARGVGLEEAARDARYEFFLDVARRYGARYVVTAHTLDDQAETVLLRILRGTGLAGLAGIPRVRPLADGSLGLVRPLLAMRRGEVLDYLAALGQEYRTDSSNAEPDYTRNRVRNDLLPQLAREFNPRIVEALTALAAQAGELREALTPIVDRLLVAAEFTATDAGFTLSCAAPAGEPRHLVRETLVAAWTRSGLPLQAMGYEEWNALADFVTGAPAKRMFPGGVAVERSGDRVVVKRM